ncbi:MAG TPA: 3D-(3,5/4)-trihydroxycyclohexane-1,2-dione acylhydrolase (decyclizing) [Woeseiaceae bacterium]|nr:3D-(3,5/4)-trihydroxycyclohexane-1,2-dione acylhydrolase (decyclizing) [Woeseiaceae bacterium]
MKGKIRLTTAQALIRYLAAQYTEIDGAPQQLLRGIFAIFGHGNVAGIGEALEDMQAEMPVYRAHNEQAMAHAAIAYAKASKRRRLMACTTSVGPGATNMVTAAAVAHVNRLPLLLLPGDTFASRLPDPVLQQLEDFSDPTITANDCFKPVSRYWDRITRPEQLLQSLPHAIRVLLDPAECGPVTLALPQDVQAESYDFPEYFFARREHSRDRAGPDLRALAAAEMLIAKSRRPLIIAGGGVLYSDAADTLAEFATRLDIPVAETQAGKGALSWQHVRNVGALGVTGTNAANELAANADLIIAIGTRLQDFTTGSGLLIRKPGCELLSINVARHDLGKRNAIALRGDANRCLEELGARLTESHTDPAWLRRAASLKSKWAEVYDAAITITQTDLPTDAQVLGVIAEQFPDNATIVCAAGGLPGELHKLWRAADSNSYHVEYGYSCMGYEIAGGMGAKLATPERDIVVTVGDGSYLMLNSEIASSIALDLKLIIVVFDNRGFACINRLQTSLGGKAYNNMLDTSYANSKTVPRIDFVAHAASLGAVAQKVPNISGLGAALARAKAAPRTAVVVIDTHPVLSTEQGGTWWDVPVAAVSDNADVKSAYRDYRDKRN